ncbi:MAG: hypothetical protein IKK57_10230 [Clostridia bacterium]|nr:hypothetical protein [Clostridia bacterium]
MKNNKHEYSIRCGVFTVIMTIGVILFYWMQPATALAHDGWKAYPVGLATGIAFAALQYFDTQKLLKIPENRADGIPRNENASNWATGFTVCFAGVLLLTSVIDNLGRLGELFAHIIELLLGIGIFCVIAYFIAYVVAWICSPKMYRPWDTQAGYEAYLAREEQRKAEARAHAARIAQSMQNSSSNTSTPPSVPSPVSVSMSDVRGHIYRSGFSGAEIGYFTGDTIYKKDGVWNDTKLGTYRDGRIDDDSGYISMHTVGRYEWSSTYGGYLIYAGDSRKEFVGRVCRNGDIQVAKQPRGVTEIVLSGVEYTTIGRFTGDPEGAAAAAYMLLFR